LGPWREKITLNHGDERCERPRGLGDVGFRGVTAGLSAVVEQLIAAARQGVELTGSGGLLTGLTKQVLETALEPELDDHLGS
jgi:hypothetical protein